MTKIYHKAKMVSERGNVSALCFSPPRAINLKKELWTIRDEAVTCPQCLAILTLSPAAQKEISSSSSGQQQDQDTVIAELCCKLTRAEGLANEYKSICPILHEILDASKITVRDGNLLERLEKLKSRIDEIHQDFQFIADQSCQQESSTLGACTETEMCITEYCWPCYAKKKLEYYKSLTSSPQNGEKGEK